MYYFNYLIKTIIRRLVYLLFNKKTIIILLLVALFVFFDINGVFAAETNVDNSAFTTYDIIWRDFISRLSTTSTSGRYDDLMTKINDSTLQMYIFYDINSSTSVDGLLPATTSIVESTENLYVAFFESSFQKIVSTYDGYYGYSLGGNSLSSQCFATPTYLYYVKTDFVGGVGSSSLKQIYLPTALLSYRSSTFTDFLNGLNNTNKITDTITNSTVSDDSMIIDTSNFDISTEQSSNDNFFTQFLNQVYQAYTGIGGSVITINLPIPFTDETISLRSDMISKYIEDTIIFDFIQLFWTFILGGYLILFSKRVFDWLSTGKIAEKGVFGFIEWLDINNEIIKSYMM